MSEGCFPLSVAVKAPCPPLTPQVSLLGSPFPPSQGPCPWFIRPGTPCVPVAQRGPRPLSPKGSWSPGEWLVSSTPSPWARALLLVWERLPYHSVSPSEATQVFPFPVGLASPELEGRLPQGPRGGQAGPVWLVLPVTEAKGPTSDLTQDPGPHGLCRPSGSHRIDHLSILHPEGLPATRNLSAAERRPRVSLLRYF